MLATLRFMSPLRFSSCRTDAAYRPGGRSAVNVTVLTPLSLPSSAGFTCQLTDFFSTLGKPSAEVKTPKIRLPLRLRRSLTVTVRVAVATARGGAVTGAGAADTQPD